MLIIASIILGLAVWTFAEYVLHRFAGHVARGRNHFSREHLRHHGTPGYFSPNGQKLLSAVVAVPIAGGAWALIAGWAAGAAFGIAFGLAYLGYELAHRRIHTHPPRGRYGRWARRHHLHHHFADPTVNHGVTVAFWDRVFGTYAPVRHVTVPRRRSLEWMLDADGALRPEFTDEYTIGAGRMARAA